MINKGSPASVPVWGLAHSLIIPAGTADAEAWMDVATPGGATASTNAIKAGSGRRWGVEALHVNLSADTAQAGGLLLSVQSIDSDKSTILESIPFRFFSKGSYVVPVMWVAYAADKYLRIIADNDAATTAYYRAVGVRSHGPESS